MKIKVYAKEIMYRVNFIVGSFITNLIVLYNYKEEIIFIIGQHQTTNSPHFITTNLPEMLICIVKLCVYINFYITIPLLTTQLCLFLAPAMYRYEYKWVRNVIMTASVCYLIGCFATYKILLPYCWKFFSGFQLNQQEFGISIQLEARLHEYIQFLNEIFFTLNIVIGFCTILNFILMKFSIHMLTKLRKIMYFLSYIIATLITPPDIFSQIAIGSCFIVTYEIFVLLILVTQEYKRANNGTRTRNLQSHNLTL